MRIPIRGVVSISNGSSRRAVRTVRGPRVTSAPFCARVMSSASVSTARAGCQIAQRVRGRPAALHDFDTRDRF